MSDSLLVLTYWRRHELEGDEHLFDANVGNPDGEVRFEGLSFEEVILRFSEFANLEQHAKSSLYIARGEVAAPGALLSESEADTLRKDPTAFARALSFPVSRVVLRLGSNTGPAVPPIKAGYASLADAFGDHAYLRTRAWPSPVVECPICGRWKASVVDSALECQCMPPKIKGEVTPDRKWFKVATRELLDAGRFIVQRFFLPRAWNPSGSWVSYEDLKAKYEAFTKERESCFSPKVAK